MPTVKNLTPKQREELVGWLSETPDGSMMRFKGLSFGPARALRVTRRLLHKGDLSAIGARAEESDSPPEQEVIVEGAPENGVVAEEQQAAILEEEVVATQEEVPVVLEPTNPSPEDEVMADAGNGEHISSAEFFRELGADRLKMQELQHQIETLTEGAKKRQAEHEQTQAALSKTQDVVAAVDTLKETVKDMGDSRQQQTEDIVTRLEETDKRASEQAALLEQKPDKEDIPALMVQCAEGNQEMCDVIFKQLPPEAQAKLQPGNPADDAEPHLHHGAEEFLACPECSAAFLEEIKTNPKLTEFRQAMIEATNSGSEDEIAEMVKKVEEAGKRVVAKSLF